MDSGNSASISSSGDEEYDSRPPNTNTILPSTFHPSQFASSFFDLSSTYLPNSFLNLDTATSSSSSQPRRSQPDCTLNANVTSPNMNQSLLPPPAADNARPVLSSPQANTNVVRNSKKRTRASRRAPTTVLTTDTSNFRAMVQEFTGIPAPPFSASSSYSRRLDLLTASTTPPFYPLRPSPQKVQHHHHHHHQNPLLLSSSSSPYSNMVDAIASTTTTITNNNNNNSSSNNNTNHPIHYQQQLPPDLGLPYPMLNMQNQNQNHPTLAFHPPLHPFGHPGFNAKLPSIEDLGMSHAQVNNNNTANFVASGVSVPLRSVNDGGGGGTSDVSLRSLDGGGSCKLNFSAASASISLNHEKSTLQNNNNNNNAATRGEGNVDSWICSSD